MIDRRICAVVLTIALVLAGGAALSPAAAQTTASLALARQTHDRG